MKTQQEIGAELREYLLTKVATQRELAARLGLAFGQDADKNCKGKAPPDVEHPAGQPLFLIPLWIGYGDKGNHLFRIRKGQKTTARIVTTQAVAILKHTNEKVLGQKLRVSPAAAPGPAFHPSGVHTPAAPAVIPKPTRGRRFGVGGSAHCVTTMVRGKVLM